MDSRDNDNCRWRTIPIKFLDKMAEGNGQRLKRQSIKNSTVLVVGGAGFISSHLVDHLITKMAKQVIIIDNLFIGKKKTLTMP